jgi:hypothetical protein
VIVLDADLSRTTGLGNELQAAFAPEDHSLTTRQRHFIYVANQDDEPVPLPLWKLIPLYAVSVIPTSSVPKANRSHILPVCYRLL